VKAMPVVVLLGAAVILGIFLGYQYLRRVRSRPVLIGVHLLLGAGGLEVLAVLLRGAPDGDTLAPGKLGKVAAGLVVLALFSGLLAPMLGRRSRETMNIALATHAAVALAGFTLVLVWILGSR